MKTPDSEPSASVVSSPSSPEGAAVQQAPGAAVGGSPGRRTRATRRRGRRQPRRGKGRPGGRTLTAGLTRRSSRGSADRAAGAGGPALGGGLVQRYSDRSDPSDASQIRDSAEAGLLGANSRLPYRDSIQRSFGRHDVSQIQAKVGGSAADACEDMGANAYASGQKVAFRSQPDLHTAAHEAAHVVQQTGGVQLEGGVGRQGDRYERHADAVADRVVRGESAEALLDEYSGSSKSSSSAAVQGKSADCDCGDCAICEERKRDGGASGSAPVQASAAPVQMDLLDDATQWAQDAGEAISDTVEDVGEAVGDAVDAVREWIDLLGPKRDLLQKITDPAWITDAVTTAQEADANPKHKLFLDLSLMAAGVGVGGEAFGYALRIAGCNSLEEVEELEKEFDAWKAERQPTLVEELEEVVEEYREAERGWLTAFGSAGEIAADPVHPNASDQDVRLAFQPGVTESKVTVETRVNCTFGRTSNAMQDNDGDGKPDVADWTDEEKEHFMSRFQEQLDHIWTTGAGSTAPFRLTQPEDHLLADESPKWSEITATMKAQVTADSANPHFTLDVNKEAAGESNRAHVGTNDGTFYIGDADAGYHTSGPMAGQPSGDQMTLAHEWHHMIGNPDEYAESSQSQSASASTPASRSGDWNACQTHFNDIINDPASSPAEKAQAQQDLQALQNHATDTDGSTPGFQSGVFPLAGRDDVPDECFAIRGTWDEGPEHLRLRPGAQSQRGGTNISQNADDAARLSDRGNQVRPYMREGVVQELRNLLEGSFDPEVQFDHNFQEMSLEEITETIQARVQNILHDQVSLGASSAPADRVPEGPHDHGDEGGHDH